MLVELAFQNRKITFNMLQNEVEKRKKMWDLDNAIDNVVDFLIINVSSNSSASSSKSDL